MPKFPNVSVYGKALSERVYSSLAERALARGGPIFKLHVGDTYREPPEMGRAENQRSADHERLHNYAPVQGEPVLLEAIQRYVEHRHGILLEPDNIQVMSGATAGLNVVCQVLLEPGDEVLLPAPFWPLSRGIIQTKGAVATEVPFFTRLDEPGFDPVATLESAITPKTVALYINTPHNPTGNVLPPTIIRAMLGVAEKHGLWVLADEAYEEIYFDDKAPQAIWTYPEAASRTIACHTLSKSYGLAGSRVGFTHGPPDVMRRIRGMQTFQTYCAPRPLQFGAARALNEGAAWLTESRQLYAKAGAMTADAVGLAAPRGGTFLFFDVSAQLPAGATNTDVFLEACADQGVLLTPGASCGAAYATWVRLCYTAVPPDELSAALQRLKALLAD